MPAAAPAITIDENLAYYAIVELEKEVETVIFIKLFAKRATETVNNFIHLARQGFYDGLTFHHVVGGLLAQTGDPTDTEFDGPGYSLQYEFHPELRHDSAGIVAMANSDDETAPSHGSQFYITLAPAPHLDGMNTDGSLRDCKSVEISCHSVFGKVVKGIQRVSALNWKLHLNNIKVGDVIRKIEILELTAEEDAVEFQDHDCAGGSAIRDAINNPRLVHACDVLLNIKATFEGDDANLNWSDNYTMTLWDRVDINLDHDRIVALDLGELDLVAPFPAEIVQLTDLEFLLLNDNQFYGPLPRNLGDLTDLIFLDLSNNQLDGTIPASLGNLKAVQILNLSNNMLSGNIPHDLGNIPRQIDDLDLSDNLLTGQVPIELINDHWYAFFRIDGNQLTGCIPNNIYVSEISEFGNLQLCDETTTDGAPPLEPARSSDSVSLGDGTGCSNGIAISAEIYSPELAEDCEVLLSIRETLAGDAELNWSIDRHIYEWDGIWIAGVPERVTNIDLPQFGLNGILPDEISKLSQLQVIELNENELKGEIPASLAELKELTVLSLIFNQFSGTIPRELTTLSNLEDLDISNNDLTGTIPDDLGKLTNLFELRLGYNNLVGHIPDISGLVNLEVFGVSGNRLTGPVPTELADLKSLWLIGFRDNRLEGELPDELALLENLNALFISGNNLVGCLNDSFADIVHLEKDLPLCRDIGPLVRPETTFEGGADLSVVYIERLPKYDRYNDISYLDCITPIDPDQDNISYCSSSDDLKRWPDPGETVQLFAHIANFGDTASGPFNYDWKLNNQISNAGVHPGLESGEWDKVLLEIPWPGKQENPTITITLDSSGQIEEVLENNNELVDWIKGYTIGFYFSTAAYESLRYSNREGEPYQSPEHWIHQNIVHLNEMLQSAGLEDRVRTEQFYVSSELYRYDFVYPQVHRKLDGSWPLTDNFHIYTPQGYRNRPEIDNGLIHELLHQLGVIDIYVMKIGPSQVLVPDVNRPGVAAGCSIYPDTYDKCNILPEAIEDIMSGGPQDVIGIHTAGGLRSNTGYRRGYYGEYLLDTPAKTSIRIVDGNGAPIPNVRLRMFQLENKEFIGRRINAMPHIDDISEIEVVTDVTGIALLPNRGTTGIVTPTGHQLQPNPFGIIDVVGYNGLFLIEMTSQECTNYEWLTIMELNLAYWDGHTEGATFTKSLDCTTLLPKDGEGCHNGIAIPKYIYNRQIANDCEVLLEIKDILGPVNDIGWDTSISILEWEGITVNGFPARVTEINLSYKGLSGVIPHDIMQLTALQHINFSDNELTGSIPQGLMNLSALQYLYISENQLVGGIPNNLSQLTNLIGLNLSGNPLGGHIPDMRGLINLEIFHFNGNSLTGDIPKEWANLHTLKEISLEDNFLDGEVPNELASLPNLQQINIKENDLSGCISNDFKDNIFVTADLPFCSDR